MNEARGLRAGRCGIVVVVVAALSTAVGAGCKDPRTEAPPPVVNLVADWRDEIIYQIFVDRFANGDLNNDFNVDRDAPARYHGGDWQGIIDRLDYLEELGVTALWITPVVKNLEEDAGVSSYHGYWTQSFVETNPHFGDLAKLRELTDAAHARDMKVILDVVTNHIAQLFYYDINLNGSPDENVFGDGMTSPVTRVTEWDPDFNPAGVQAFTSLGLAGPAPIRWVWIPEINRIPPEPAGFENPDWYNKMGRVYDWNDPLQVLIGDFPGGLKDLKTSNPAVQDALLEVFSYWIGAAGFDGFRIDTVKHVEHEAWQDFCTGIREYCDGIGKENFFMFGEVFDGDDALLGSYTFGGELDSVFYFSHKFQVFDDVFKWQTTPTRRIEDLFNARAMNYSTSPHALDDGLPATRTLVNFMDNHDVARTLFEHPSIDPPLALRNALAYLMTIDGIPCIYYGTEQEFSGGNDPANREDLWASGYATDGETFQHLRRLIRIRKAYEALRRGDMSIRWSTDRMDLEQDAGIIAFERSCSAASGCDATTVLVVVNVHEAKASETSASSLGGGPMVTTFVSGTRLVNVLDDTDPNDEFTVSAGGELVVTVPARGAKVLVPEGEVVAID